MHMNNYCEERQCDQPHQAKLIYQAITMRYNMSLEPPNPVHVFVQPGTRNPVAKWHYKHMENRNKEGNLEGRIVKIDALVHSNHYCYTNTLQAA